jgi:hypothetical protein
MPTVSQSVVNIGPGQGDIEDWVDLAFYGIRQDSVTGAASIDKIIGDAPISLPDQFTVRSNDYKNWVWTKNTFQFYWGEQGRLIMEVL